MATSSEQYRHMTIRKRTIAIVLSSLLMVAVAIVGIAYVELTRALRRPDLQANAITKYIKDQGAGKRWGTLVSLIPEALAPNSSRTEVEQRLASAGFTRLHDDKFLGSAQPDLYQQREVYSREANNLVCNIQLYVFVSFDQVGELTLAEATQYERGCS